MSNYRVFKAGDDDTAGFFVWVGSGRVRSAVLG